MAAEETGISEEKVVKMLEKPIKIKNIIDTSFVTKKDGG